MGSHRPASWRPVLAAPWCACGANAQDLAIPQDALAPQVKRQLSLLTHDQCRSMSHELQIYFADSETCWALFLTASWASSAVKAA